MFTYPDHDDVIKWKHFPRYWLFVRGIHRSTVNSPHKGQWRGAWMLSLICAWINGRVNNREAGDLRRHRAHCDVIVLISLPSCRWPWLVRRAFVSLLHKPNGRNVGRLRSYKEIILYRCVLNCINFICSATGNLVFIYIYIYMDIH